MDNEENILADWRERCNDAFELMRDSASAARRIGMDLMGPGGDAAAAADLPLQRLCGEVVLAYVNFREHGDPQAGAELERLLPLVQATGDRRSIINCAYCLMAVHSGRGAYEMAYQTAHQHLKPFLPGEPCREVARSLNLMGVLATEFNRPEEAMRYYFSALTMVRTLGLPLYWSAHIKANIGELLVNGGNPEEAEPLLLEALEMVRTCDKPWLLFNISTMVAMCELALDKYDAAYEVIADQVIAIERSIANDPGGNISHGGLCLSIAAFTLAENGQLERAEHLFALVMARIDQFSEKQHQCYIWWVGGHLHHRRGNLAQAAQALGHALESIGQIDFDFVALRALNELNLIQAEQGQWQAAYETHQRYHAMFFRSQGRTQRMHLQIEHIQGELADAANARREAEQAVAERKQLAESLEQSLIERDIILENSMVGIAFLNLEGRVQWLNHTMSDIFGFSPAQGIGQTLERCFASPEAYQEMRRVVAHALDQNDMFETECRMQRTDGSQFWAYASGRSVSSQNLTRGAVWVVMDISRRRQLEEDLNKSEEQHRQVVDNATEGIIVEQHGQVVFANPRAIEQTHRSREELMAMQFLDLVHPDDRAEALSRHQRRWRGEDVPLHHSFRAINPVDGSIQWCESSGVKITWEGQPATLIFINDVTERKHLEDSLKESLEERETVLENSMVGIAFVDPNGGVKWANRPLLQMFGVAHGDYIGISMERFYRSPQEYLHTSAEALLALKRGRPFTTELIMQRGNGSQFWVALSGRSVNRNDVSQGTVWAMVDIDNRRRLETALLKSEEHHRQVVDNVTEGIIVSQDGKIVFANPRVSQISGRTEEELFSMPFLTDVHPDDVAMVINEHQRRIRGENHEKYYAFRIVHPHTGDVHWIEMSAVMIEWEGRAASLSFLNDITERKRLEDSLKQSHLERVRLQTLKFQSELSEAEVARRHAEETTKAKSMFLANMSHEIRTPMNAIIGMAHLTLCSELSLKQRDYVEKIHGAGISLLGIINDILDFSRIEAGKLSIETVDFSLDKVLRDVVTVTGGKAQEKELEYHFSIPPEIPRNLLGDPLRLGQIMINLVNNAIKFTEFGGVYLQCAQRQTSADRIELEFVVRDTGIGISAGQSAKLFSAFSQADESTTRRYGGTGLGLSIAKAMVELMDGTIWLESEEGIGTSMYFTAWFGLPEAHARDQLVPEQLEGMRVLVVDDSPAARLHVSEILSALPLDVDFAFGSGEALTAIRACDASWPYGIVFANLEMPGLSGINLVWEVKKDASLKSPPRMLLLVEPGRNDVQRYAEDPMLDGLLLKPVNGPDLLKLLAQLFANQHQSKYPFTSLANDIPVFHDLVVLLAEDNEINQMVAIELMRLVGVTVEVAANGKIALDILQSSAPDHFGLILMDVQMPEMDGHEASQRIRSDARFSSVPIVAMTAHAMLEERDRCLASGMNDHVAKPINPGEFYQTLERWCPSHLQHGASNERWASPSASTGHGLRIPGFDVEEGLDRMMGDRAIYLELLARFREGQADAAAAIRNALAADDRDLAERLAHTLKGVAGMVSAKDLYVQAAVLEAKIRDGETAHTIDQDLVQIERDLHTLMAGLGSVLEVEVATLPAETGGTPLEAHNHA
jgi:two-component system sensor histidine kinase/response regulator